MHITNSLNPEEDYPEPVVNTSKISTNAYYKQYDVAVEVLLRVVNTSKISTNAYYKQWMCCNQQNYTGLQLHLESKNVCSIKENPSNEGFFYCAYSICPILVIRTLTTPFSPLGFLILFHVMFFNFTSAFLLASY